MPVCVFSFSVSWACSSLGCCHPTGIPCLQLNHPSLTLPGGVRTSQMSQSKQPALTPAHQRVLTDFAAKLDGVLCPFTLLHCPQSCCVSAKKIKIVVFDMDRTIISQHSKGAIVCVLLVFRVCVLTKCLLSLCAAGIAPAYICSVNIASSQAPYSFSSQQRSALYL